MSLTFSYLAPVAILSSSSLIFSFSSLTFRILSTCLAYPLGIFLGTLFSTISSRCFSLTVFFFYCYSIKDILYWSKSLTPIPSSCAVPMGSFLLILGLKVHSAFSFLSLSSLSSMASLLDFESWQLVGLSSYSDCWPSSNCMVAYFLEDF